ncbi:MAG: transcriptional regulator [Frankiales bacterium]|nr:transcriptional regulator [Frankiales bacterium]
MRVAIYVRVSTDRQDIQGVSLEGQVAQIRDWARVTSHEVVAEYIERGFTGTDERRPEFQRMMADALSPEHPFDAVVAFHLKELTVAGLVTQERSGRNLIYRAAYKQMNALLGYLTENCCQGAACAVEPAAADCRC